MALRKQKGFISGLSFSSASPSLLASVSYDKTLAIWDTRAATSGPLHTIAVHRERAFAVHWCSADRIVTGGADKRIRVVSLSAQNRAKETGADEEPAKKKRAAKKKGAAVAPATWDDDMEEVDF